MTAFGLLETHFSLRPIAVGLPAISGTDSEGAAVIGTQVVLVFGAGIAAETIEWRLDGDVIVGETAATLTVPAVDGGQLTASVDGKSTLPVVIRYALPSLQASLANQSFETDNGVQVYDASHAFSFSGTPIYTITAGFPGVSISTEGMVRFDTSLTPTTPATPITLRLSDAGDATRFVEASFTLTVSQVADTIAPILSAANAAANGTSAYTGVVTTNETGGTLFVLVSQSVSETGAAVKAAGVAQAISQAGVQTISGGGLSAATSYRLHLLHRDAAGNDSAVLSSAIFMTDAAPSTDWVITDNGDGTFAISSAPPLSGALTVTDNGDGTFDIAA